MADVEVGGEGSGKSGKKNQKRRNKAKKSALKDGLGSSVQQPGVDPVEELRQRLNDAKISKDLQLVGKLRKQLWVVQDLSAGVTPDIDPSDKESQAILDEFLRTGIISLQPSSAEGIAEKAVEEVPKPDEPVFLAPVAGGEVVENKRLKNLNKKLKQIEDLKEKQKKGEKLESNQLEKIKSEESVRQDIQEIEQLISKLSAQIKS